MVQTVQITSILQFIRHEFDVHVKAITFRPSYIQTATAACNEF